MNSAASPKPREESQRVAEARALDAQCRRVTMHLQFATAHASESASDSESDADK